MALFVILIILIVAFAAWQLVQSRSAVATTSVLTRFPEHEAVQMIQSAFSGGTKSLLWTDGKGPGRINKRRRAGSMRGVKLSITMSIDITPEPNGQLRIDMWASDFASYMGVFVNFAGAVTSRKKAIAQMLASPDSASPVGQAGSTAALRPEVSSAASTSSAARAVAPSTPAPAVPQTAAPAAAVGEFGAAPSSTVPAGAGPKHAKAPAGTAAAAAPITSEDEMTKEMAYSLAAMCEEASRLYDECIDKAEMSERARAMSQTEYVDGVQQHPISKQNFASMADGMEVELTSLLQQLHDLSAKSHSMWSDFLFLAGGANSDFSAAMLWCAEHGLDSNAVSTLAVQSMFLHCDFGLTKASFLKENDRLTAALEAHQQ